MKTKMSGMQLGNNVLGDQIVEHAVFENVKVLGTLQAKHCDYENLKILGTARLQDCKVDQIVINGEVHGEGCMFHDAKVLGEMKLRACTLHNIHVLGELRGEQITCHILSYGGNRKLHLFGRAIQAPQIKGRTLENFFPLELNGKQRFDAIINAGKLIAYTEVECASFFNFCELRLTELNADFCYIEPNHKVRVREIHGSLIIIDPCFEEKWLKDTDINMDMGRFYQRRDACNTVIECIEADEVIVDCAHVKTIRADRVILGPHAVVDHVEYHDSFQAHERARVKQANKVAQKKEG